MFDEYLTDLMSEINFLQEQTSDPEANSLLNEQMFLVYAILQNFSLVQAGQQSPEEYLAYLQELEGILQEEMKAADNPLKCENVATKQKYLQDIRKAFVSFAYPELSEKAEAQMNPGMLYEAEEKDAVRDESQALSTNTAETLVMELQTEEMLQQALLILDELRSHTDSPWQAEELRAENKGFYLGYLTAVERMTGKKIDFDKRSERHYFLN